MMSVDDDEVYIEVHDATPLPVVKQTRVLPPPTDEAEENLIVIESEDEGAPPPHPPRRVPPAPPAPVAAKSRDPSGDFAASLRDKPLLERLANIQRMSKIREQFASETPRPPAPFHAVSQPSSSGRRPLRGARREDSPTSPVRRPLPPLEDDALVVDDSGPDENVGGERFRRTAILNLNLLGLLHSSTRSCV